jgi:hypothetical protein
VSSRCSSLAFCFAAALAFAFFGAMWERARNGVCKESSEDVLVGVGYLASKLAISDNVIEMSKDTLGPNYDGSLALALLW